MSDLDKLIKAVEAGTLPEAVFHGASVVRGHWSYTTGLDADQRRSTYLAYRGSLDAALRLHDALLPGWDYHLWNLGADEAGADVAHHQHGQIQDSAISSNQARAWLLAILKALRAKEAGE